jgi:hypothetical protein
MPYWQAYDYYAKRLQQFSDTIFLKCDDDIVYMDVGKLDGFIEFRRANPNYFVVSANVVNNGVCAFFQQSSGVIPLADGAFEMPPGGFCGSLWGEGKKAERLHRLFLDDPQRFAAAGDNPIVWNERISINFIAMLGSDLRLIPDLMRDDEHDLCYGVRKRARKVNGIDPRFVASHLSFWRQDADMDVAQILHGYETLADRAGVAPERAAG